MLKALYIILLSSVVGYGTSAQQKDSLLQIIAKNANDAEQLKALNQLANVYMRSDLPKAKEIQLQAIKLAKNLDNDILLSSGYVQMVSIMHNTGSLDSAATYLELLKNLAEQPASINNAFIQSNYLASAGLYYKRTGELKKAIPIFQKAIAIARSTGKKENVAGQYINLGNTYNLMGAYRNAIDAQLNALKLFEEAGNQKGQSFCYQNISNSMIEMKQFSNALTYAKKSLQIKLLLDDKRGLCTAETGLGQIYLGLGKIKESLLHLSKAAALATDLQLMPELTKIKFNTAKAYLEKGDTAAAKKFFNASKEHAVLTSDSSTISAIGMELIALEKKKENNLANEELLRSNINVIRQAGQLPKEAAGYQRIADYYVANLQYDKALEYTKKFHAFTDSLNNNELLLQIKKIEEQYNLDKKEKEIAILKKDRQLQKVTIEKQKLYQAGSIVFLALIAFIAMLIINRNRTIQKSRQMLAMEKMRNGIARDLHDDIGSTLTSINILSKVMLQEAGENETSQRNNLQKIKEHSSSIMDSMSDIVWAINPHNDTVEKVIFKMKEFAAEALDPLNIAFQFSLAGDFSQVRLTLEKRKDLYLIFKEAVNNAAKYSNCDNVNILLKHEEEKIQLQVSDNGKGFDEQAVKYGNGVKNMRERANNMLASLIFKTIPGSGTDIQLTIPLT